ncbi:MAG: hypothetical protein CME61_02640 [Halobacteriovoraceae bacterium]|nr:hypothetical protein [Halobacteriovoraceae bacterium]
MLKIIFCIFLNLFAFKSFSNNVAPNDLPYYSVKINKYNFIFPQEYQSFTRKIVDTLGELIPYYEEIYDHELDEQTDIMLGSHYNQIGNGFATMQPNSQTVLYPGGMFLFDDFATTNWLATLTYHELSHLYQLNVKNSQFSKFSRFLFGNNWVGLFPLPINLFPFVTVPFPLFTFPNVLLPDFLLEGNAVFNESRFGYGGRLYSGHLRAIYYLLVKESLLDDDRIINNHFHFPFNREKYIFGGYFYNWAVFKYGEERAHKFFKEHSNHSINPLRLNSTFESFFKDTFSEIVYESMRSHRLNSSPQVKDKRSKVVAKSLISNPLNKNEDGIYFLVNEAQTHQGEIVVISPEEEVFKKKTNLKNGKLFYFDRKFYSAALGLVERNKMLPALWGENKKLKPGSENKYYFDYYAGRHLVADGEKSMERPHLFINGEDKGKSFSSSLLHPGGGHVYFDQKGKTRTLMHGNKKLISYQGFYGKPVDVFPTGGVLFVGPTRFGSGLFMYSMGETFRVTNSDLIVDARWLKNDEFVVCEVGLDGYEYKIIKNSKTFYEKPYEYAYFFEKDGYRLNIPFEKRKPSKSTFLKNEEKISEYNSFKQIRFSRMDFFLNNPLYGKSIKRSTLVFTDPLQFNNIFIEGENDNQNRTEFFKFNYLNTKNLLNWGGTFEYEDLLGSTGENEEALSLKASFKYHYFRKDDWDLFLSTEFGGTQFEETFYHSVSFSAELFKSYRRALSFDPFDYVSYYVEVEDNFQGILGNGLFSYSEYYENNYFFQAELLSFYTNRSLFTYGDFTYPKGKLFPLFENGFFLTEPTFGGGATIGLKKVFDLNWYGFINPLNIRRLGVLGFVGAQNVNEFSSYYGTVFDFELVLGHRLITRANISYLSDGEENSMSLNLSNRF